MDFQLQKIQRDIEIKGFNSIYYFEFDKNFSHLPEKHDFWELVYVDNGDITAIVITDHQPNSVERGDWAKKETKTVGDKIVDIHSHPSDNSMGASDKDRSNINSKNNTVYLKKDKTLHEYTKNNSSQTAISINGIDDLYKYIFHLLK